MSFDPEAIRNTAATMADEEGKREMVAEGTYPNSTITDVTPYEPHDKAKERGIKARLRVVFDCPTSDVDLSTFVNFKLPVHSRSTYAKLLRALWPDKEEAALKTPDDLVGETVNVNVFHEETVIDGKNVNFAEFRFTNCK